MAATRLSKTLGTPTDNKKWTWSAWIKRSKSFNVVQRIFYAINSSNYTTLQFDDESNLIFFNEINGVGTDMQLKTSQVFRDAGAWYNIVIAYDSANSTAADRQIIYINGVRVTSFAIENTATINANTAINQAVPHTVGSSDGGGNYFEGLMSYTTFVDGTAYPATSFGSVNAASGIWTVNTSPSVTYGNNGFLLKMDTSSPGADSSGKNNTFTAAGTPTLAQNNASNNLATLNNLDGASMAKNSTFSNGNTTVICSGSDTYRPYGTTIGVSKGKWYAEFQANANMGDGIIGVFANYSGVLALSRYADSYGWYNSSGGNIQTNDSAMTGGSSVGTYATNDIIQIALDLDNNKVHFNKNNTGWLNGGNPATNAGGYAITDPDSTSLGFYFMSVVDWGGGVRGNWDCNFGNGFFGVTAVTSSNADAAGYGLFEYAVPTGFFTINTKNLNTYGG